MVLRNLCRLLDGKNCACPLVVGDGSCTSGGQGCINVCVFEVAGAQADFAQSVC